MCLIVYQPVKITRVLTPEEFDALSQDNRIYVGGYYDPWHPGAGYANGPLGIMWTDGDKLHTKKTADGNHAPVYEKYKSLVGKTPLILHWRTHAGGVENTQPFVTKDKKVGFALNGQIDPFGDNRKSDARQFTETLLNSISPTAALTSKAFHKAMALMLDYSVAALMDNKGRVKLFGGGRHSGAGWRNGLWYSHD